MINFFKKTLKNIWSVLKKVSTFALAKRKTAVPQWRSGFERGAPKEILKKLAKRFAPFKIST